MKAGGMIAELCAESGLARGTYLMAAILAVSASLTALSVGDKDSSDVAAKS